MSSQSPQNLPPRKPGSSSRPTSAKPTPEEIKLRRYKVAGIVGIIVLAIIGLFVRSSMKETKQKEAAEEQANSVVTVSAPAMDPTATPTPTASATAIAPTCNPNDISISAAVDQEVYTATDKPQLKLNITNTGKQSCLLNVGTSQQTYVISKKGGAQIWSSADCAEKPTDEQRLLSPNKTEVAVMPWKRTLSSAGCAAPDGVPQPGQYTLTVKLGDKTSSPVDFLLQ